MVYFPLLENRGSNLYPALILRKTVHYQNDLSSLKNRYLNLSHPLMLGKKPFYTRVDLHTTKINCAREMNQNR